jgi:hypothetical protein
MPGGEGIMRGVWYRLGVRIKDFGERMAPVRLFGIPVLRPFSGPVISLGYAVKEWGMAGPIGK